jgi:hypothetical protein
MMRIAALGVAAALFTLPAVAQTKGKSTTAPGQATSPHPAPGQTDDPKTNAPGQKKPDDGSAKTFAPGQFQKNEPNPSKKN